MIACVHEDRADAVVGLKLTLLSLRQHAPEVPAVVSAPGAPPDLGTWVHALQSARLREGDTWTSRGWDVKPDLLLRLLAEGHEDVVWIDSDIVLAGPLPEPLLSADPTTLVATEEPFWDTRVPVDRAAAWELPPGRRLPWTLNSGLLRVTPHHVALLEAWRELLTDPRYLAAQRQPWHQRPPHLVGDQGVLEALLCSRRFADVPVVLLRRGEHIAQCHGAAGFTPGERLRTLAARRGTPPLVHVPGAKPWSAAEAVPDASLRDRLVRYVARLHLELSPYTAVAAAHEQDLGEPAPWLHPRTALGRGLARLTARHPVAQELPLAVLDATARQVRLAVRRGLSRGLGRGLGRAAATR